jgi:hypothetical protein
MKAYICDDNICKLIFYANIRQEVSIVSLKEFGKDNNLIYYIKNLNFYFAKTQDDLAAVYNTFILYNPMDVPSFTGKILL